MTIATDIQKLEPGAVVELFEVDSTSLGGDVLRFHNYLQTGPITWQGNEYTPWPIQGQSFARDSSAQQPQPTITVSNVDGSISAMCILLGDMVGSVVRRHRTLAEYLDAVNFAGPVHPASNTQFGTGNGSTADFQLIGADGVPVIQAVSVDSIYRTDWQGRQLLYATPRTNLLANSEQIGGADWGASSSNITVTLGQIGPDGNATGALFSDIAGGGSFIASASTPETAGTLYSGFVYFKPGSAVIPSIEMYDSTLSIAFGQAFINVSENVPYIQSFAGYESVSIDPNEYGSGWYCFRFTITSTSDAIVFLVRASNYASGTTSFALPQFGSPGSYIPTTTAPVTVTDYVLSPSGQVTLGQVPVSGASLTWTGTGESSGNPNADPTAEIPVETWIVDQKTSETNLNVEFTLCSALDFSGRWLPSRQVLATLCPWDYRGTECGWTGTTYYDANNNPVSNAAQDVCSKRLSGCQCRWGASNPLTFGGFPSAGTAGNL